MTRGGKSDVLAKSISFILTFYRRRQTSLNFVVDEGLTTFNLVPRGRDPFVQRIAPSAGQK